jgi:DNA anti-recombination protein RmuC
MRAHQLAHPGSSLGATNFSKRQVPNTMQPAYNPEAPMNQMQFFQLQSMLQNLHQTVVSNHQQTQLQFERVDQRFEEFEQRVEQRFQEFEERVDQRFQEFDERVDQRFQEFEDRVNHRFQEFDERVDRRFQDFEQSVDQRFKDLEQKMDQRFDLVDEQFVKVDQRFDALETSVDLLVLKLIPE